MLDTTRKYTVRTPDECWWLFQYESRATLEGYRAGWKAYRRRPDRETWQSQGNYPEIEILYKLKNYSHKLDDDDLLDLQVLLHGNANQDEDHNWLAYLGKLKEEYKDYIKEVNERDYGKTKSTRQEIRTKA